MSKNPVTRGSGNVFEDLGLPDSAGLAAKAELVHKLSQIIESKKLTQKEAAVRLGVDQAKISVLLRGRFEGFSIERLITFLAALDHRVTLNVKRTKAKAA